MRSRWTLPCWFKPTCSGAAVHCDVRIGWNDETEPKPEPRAKGQRRSAPRLKPKKLGAEARAQGIPSQLPLPDESGKGIILQWLVEPRPPCGPRLRRFAG